MGATGDAPHRNMPTNRPQGRPGRCISPLIVRCPQRAEGSGRGLSAWGIASVGKGEGGVTRLRAYHVTVRIPPVSVSLVTSWQRQKVLPSSHTRILPDGER